MTQTLPAKPGAQRRSDGRALFVAFGVDKLWGRDWRFARNECRVHLAERPNCFGNVRTEDGTWTIVVGAEETIAVAAVLARSLRELPA